MYRIVTYFLLVAAICITAGGGAFHGQVSHRWGGRADVSRVAQTLNTFPSRVGNWQSREGDSFTLPKPVIELLQCKGYLSRRYFNEQTGESVNIAVLLGPSGPISVHTPEVCYSSREFKQVGDRKPVTVSDTNGNEYGFWGVTFESTRVEKTDLKVYYAWSFDGRWQPVESPRFTFAGKPYLFKIQLATTLAPDSDPSKNDPGRNFLVDFVPALNQHLFPNGAKATTRD